MPSALAKSDQVVFSRILSAFGGGGRVEVWRGGLGFGLLPCQGFPVRGAISACHAPFPHPAHRTRRAGFPHRALRLASPTSTRRSVFASVVTPRTAHQPAPHGVLVESHDLSPLGLPVLPVDSSSTHAIATTPARPVESCRSFHSTSGGLPCRSGRSALALPVSRSARRSLTLWPACLLTPQGSLFLECFSSTRYLREPLQVLPVGATSYRAGFAPARINKPFTAHRPKQVVDKGIDVRAMPPPQVRWRKKCLSTVVSKRVDFSDS
jgi:hypothetical protein